MTFNVNVRDTKPPTISLGGYPGGNVPTGTAVSYQASATDTVDGNVPVNCNPASGFTSSTSGAVTVSCDATDKAGNKASATFSVTFVAPTGGSGPTGSGGQGSGGGGSGDSGAGGSQSGDGSAPSAQGSAAITVPTKQTPLKKPPPTPKAPPPRYGVIKSVHATPTKTSLSVAFRFSQEPLNGARLRTTWYYNNKKIGEAVKTRAQIVRTLLTSGSKLPSGYWRCALEVEFGGGAWHAVKEARILLP
jgi:hypothetical protein